MSASTGCGHKAVQGLGPQGAASPAPSPSSARATCRRPSIAVGAVIGVSVTCLLFVLVTLIARAAREGAGSCQMKEIAGGSCRARQPWHSFLMLWQLVLGNPDIAPAYSTATWTVRHKP